MTTPTAVAAAPSSDSCQSQGHISVAVPNISTLQRTFLSDPVFIRELPWLEEGEREGEGRGRRERRREREERCLSVITGVLWSCPRTIRIKMAVKERASHLVCLCSVIQTIVTLREL